MKVLGYICVTLALLFGMHLNNQRLTEAKNNTLRVWVTQQEYEVLKWLNPTFEQQHGVVIEMEVVPSGQVAAKLPLYIGSSGYPDIVNVSHTQITELAGSDLISPISDIFDELNILPTVKTAFKVMGEFYGIPYNAETDILFYNADQFPDGIDALSIVEDADQFSLAIDYKSIYHSLPFVTGFGGYMVGLDNFGDINFYDIGLNTENSIIGLEHMVRLLDDSLIGGTELDVYQAFIQGSANILIAPSTMLESLLEVMPNVGFQAIPNFVLNEIPYTYMRIDTYQVTRDVSNRELALEYLRFLLSDEVATARFLQNGSVAPINYETIISQDPYHLVVKKQLHRSLPLPNQVEFNYLYAPYREAARRFVGNLNQIELILNEAVREIDNLLAQ